MSDLEQRIQDELEGSLTAKGICQWMHARNRYLKGERPVDLLARGEGDRVFEAATAFSDGVYL